jgi:hypothetical protein
MAELSLDRHYAQMRVRFKRWPRVALGALAREPLPFPFAAPGLGRKTAKKAGWSLRVAAPTVPKGGSQDAKKR